MKDILKAVYHRCCVELHSHPRMTQTIFSVLMEGPADTRKHAFVLTAKRVISDFSFPSGTGAESEKTDVGLI